MPAPTSSHDLAEAAAAQLVLDRADQVIRLVGHREVRIAGDPEHLVAHHLHPGEQLVQVRAITDSSGTSVVVSLASTKRGRTSFGTFTRANVSSPVSGSRSQTAIGSDRFEM